MRQQTLEERAWERLVAVMAQDGWRPARGTTRRFDAPGSGGLVLQVYPQMDSVDGGVVMIPALSVANAEVAGLLAIFKGLPDYSAALYGRGLTDVLRDSGLQVSPYERWFIADAGTIESRIGTFRTDVNEYGTPFFRHFAGLENVIAQIKANPRDRTANEILAVACAVAGRCHEAFSALAQYEDAAASQPPLIADRTRVFAHAFRDHFSQ